MGLTAKELASLKLNSEEFKALQINADEFRDISFVQFVELLKTRLNRDIPDDPKVRDEYTRSIYNMAKVMQESIESLVADNKRLESKLDIANDELKVAKEQTKTAKKKDVWIGAALGVLASVIAGIILKIIGI